MKPPQLPFTACSAALLPDPSLFPSTYGGSLNQAIKVAVQVRSKNVQVKGVYVSFQEVGHFLQPASRAEESHQGLPPSHGCCGFTGPPQTVRDLPPRGDRAERELLSRTAAPQRVSSYYTTYNSCCCRGTFSLRDVSERCLGSQDQSVHKVLTPGWKF